MSGQPVLLGPKQGLDYLDHQAVHLPVALTALEVWRRLMAQPMPLMGLAFRIRDALVAPFGVKRIGGFSGRCPETVQVGDKLDFFLVEEVSDRCLVLTERDRHLDVMTCVSVSDTLVAITSSVQVHNWVGRLYMIPVGIAHKRIVARQLRRLAQDL